MPKIKLDIPLINACGIGSYLDVFERLEKLGAKFGAWLPKSFSNNPILQEKYGWETEKLGNPNPVIVHTGSVLLNSMALPTHPIETWIEEFEKADLKLPIIGSAYGFCAEDYARIMKMADKYVIAWELNVSCPNKQKGEESLMESMTEKVKSIVRPLREVTTKPIIVKLSPNEDYATMASIVKDHVDYIACGNTVGPGLVIDIYSRKPVLAGVYGGMSGPAIKPKNVKMVNDIYDIVKDSGVEIIAYGGIDTWEDVIEYSIAGASLFGLGTRAFMKIMPDKSVQGMTSEEVVEYTDDVWNGVQQFLIDNNTTLEELKGSLIK